MFESIYTQKQLERAQRPSLEDRLLTYARTAQVVSGSATACIGAAESLHYVQNIFSRSTSQFQALYDMTHLRPGEIMMVGGMVFVASLMVDDALTQGNSKPYKGAPDSSENNP